VSVIDLKSPKISFLSNVAVLILKILASILTGSAAVLVEFLRSVSDLVNSGLAYMGNRIALEREEFFDPFGKTMYLYVFGFAVALLALASIAVIGFLESFRALMNQPRIENTSTGVFIMLTSLCIDTIVAFLAAKDSFAFASEKGYKNPLISYIIAENIYDIAGEGIAIASLVLTNTFPLADGIASLILNIVLVSYLIKMIIENLNVLVYRSAPSEIIARAVKIALSNPAVRDVNSVKTFALEPNKYAIFMDVELDPGLSMEDVDQVIDDIKNSIARHVTSFTYVHVEPRKPDSDVGTHKRILRLLAKRR